MTISRLRSYSAAFAFVLAANACLYFSFQITFPVLPPFVADVVLNQPSDTVAEQVGLATTVLALVSVIARIPAGQLSDRIERRRFLLLGAICFIAAPMLYAISRNMPLLLLGRVVQGLGLAMFSTAMVPIAAELAPIGRRGEALGLLGASMSVAFIIAPLVGDWLAANWGYTLVFVVSATVAAVTVVLVPLTAVTRSPSGPQKPRLREEPGLTNLAGLRLALSQTGVRGGVLTMAALGIPFGAFLTFLPLFADERHIEGVGMVFSVYAATVFLTQPLAGSLTDRVGRLGPIVPGLVVTGIGTFILALDGSLWAFALAGAVFGLGGGLVRGGVDPLVQDSVPSALRGTAAAVQYTSFDFWIGVGSYPAGVLASAVGYAVTFVVSGGFSLLGAVGLATMFRGTAGVDPRTQVDSTAFN